MARNEYLRDFLLTNPSEAKKQEIWDIHLKDIGYKDGMIPCCCGNCFQWGWGTSIHGKWYIPGHEPQTEIEEPKREEHQYSPPNDLIWLLPVILIVALAGLVIGKMAEFLL